jgi:Zn-dependent metalloprotease
MDSNVSSHSSSSRAVCTFVTPDLLKTIAQSPAVSHHVQKAAARTLEIDNNFRGKRATAPEKETQKAGAAAEEAAALRGAPNRLIYNCEETEVLPGTLVRREKDAKVRDRSVNNSYEALGIGFNFFYSLFDKKLIDSLPFTCSIHYGVDYDNAVWNGEQMVFGDGDGEVFDYFSDSLDVVVHELTHAVTQYTANLKYKDQAGALNESISDVFACMAEQWHFRQTSEKGDWILGQNLFPLKRRGTALRSLKAPGTAYDDELGKDTQVAHMRDYVKIEGDNGGVHKYSGIPNHAFYLAAVKLGGNSWERAGRIWYTTLLDGRLKNNSTFKEFADLTVDNAANLFGSSVSGTVRKAWVAVGVLNP